MQNIRKIIGKTISEAVTDYSGKNSYLMLKFKEGGKVNFVSFDPQKKGSARTAITLNGREINKEIDVLVGKKIHTMKEEFSGYASKFVIEMVSGETLIVEAIGAEEDSTVDIELVIYESKLVAESLQENQYLRKGQYPLNQPQYENDENLLDLEMKFKKEIRKTIVKWSDNLSNTQMKEWIEDLIYEHLKY